MNFFYSIFYLLTSSLNIEKKPFFLSNFRAKQIRAASTITQQQYEKRAIKHWNVHDVIVLDDDDSAEDINDFPAFTKEQQQKIQYSIMRNRNRKEASLIICNNCYNGKARNRLHMALNYSFNVMKRIQS